MAHLAKAPNTSYMGSPKMAISEAQRIVFSLLERESFNSLSGADVAAQLKAKTDLWRSVYFTSTGIEQDSSGSWVFNGARQDLIALRDLAKDFLHFDTLIVLPVPGAQEALETMASGWGADIVQWVGIAEAGRVMGGKRSVLEYASDPERVLLYAWWD